MKIWRITEIEIPARGYIVRDKYGNWTHVWLQILTPVLDYLLQTRPEQSGGGMGVREASEHLLTPNYVI